MVDKKGVKKFEVLPIIIIAVLVSFLFLVYAYPGIEWGKSVGAGGAGFGGTFNATEDVAYFFNFTLNNTAGLLLAAGTYNITQVNVTLPGTFSINAEFNASSAVGDFNLTGNVLSWRNGTGGDLGMLINGSNASAWFTFNATPSTPGEYTVNVTVLHGEAANTTTFRFNMTVNDTTSPGILATDFIRPTSNFNYSGTIIVNASITDNYKTGLGVNYVNLSVYNQSGSINETIYRLSNMTGNYWNISINTSQFPDGIYNITVIVNDTSNNQNSTNITLVRFDNTVPNIVAGNFTNPAANNHNYTGTLVLNVSASDALAGMNHILFNITNASGEQNGTLLASKSGNSFNATLNLSQYPEGVYNITAWANDSAGNENNTAAILNIIFDNTAPTVTFSCTPATVYSGNTVTCACSTTDSPAGVNTTSFTASPSTSNTGTFTQNCVVVDTAGNSRTASSTYTIELGAGSSGGGGSSGGASATAFVYSKTISKTDKDLSEIKVIETSTFGGGGLGAKEKVSVKINNEDHFVGVRSLTETTALVEIASDPVQIALDIGDDAKLDLNNDRTYDIYIKLNAIINNKADITIEYLSEAIPEGAEGSIETSGEITTDTGGGQEETTGAGLRLLWWIIGIIVVIAVVWIVIQKKK